MPPFALIPSSDASPICIFWSKACFYRSATSLVEGLCCILSWACCRAIWSWLCPAQGRPDLLSQKEVPLLTKPCHLHPVQSGILIQCQGTRNNVILFLFTTYSLTDHSLAASSAQNCKTFDRKFCCVFLMGLSGTSGL